MGKIKRIPINIWDDYYEDDYIPKDKKQETYIYVFHQKNEKSA